MEFSSHRLSSDWSNNWLTSWNVFKSFVVFLSNGFENDLGKVLEELPKKDSF